MHASAILPPTPSRLRARRAQLLALVRFTLLEARRSRLPWLLLGSLVLAFTGGALAGELALTEGVRFRIALSAAGVRFAWVFIIAVYVIGSLTRELDDRGFEVALSLEITRGTWVLGKLVGFLLLAVLACAALYPMLALLAGPGASLAWCASLLAELAIVIGASAFFALSLASVPAAVVLTAAFYLLARTIDALVLIAHGSTLLAPGAWRDVAATAVDAISWVLPSLSRFAPGSWLVEQMPSAASVGLHLVQGLVYVALLAVAALVDFERRDL